MTFEAFVFSLGDKKPPTAAASGALAALWWAGRHDWERAHGIAQEAGGADAAWVHAYLHRAEGDAGNAAYWYRRAHRPIATGPLPAEWDAIAAALIAAANGEGAGAQPTRR